MRGPVLRHLERGDKQNYQEWLNQQQSEGTITQSQKAVRWSSFLSLPMEAKRQRANQAREALGRQVVPWNFGTPSTVSNAGHAQIPPRGRPTRGNTSSKRRPSERTVNANTVARPTSNHKSQHTDLTWDEFLHGYALPFSGQRIDPLNQQRAIRWTIGDMPAYTRADEMLPIMRSNVMELLCRYQQATWWPHGIYTESILTTLIITRKFGRGYPIFTASRRGTDSSCTVYTMTVTGHWSIYSWEVDHG